MDLVKNTPTYSPGIRTSNTPTASFVNRTHETLLWNNTDTNLNMNSKNEKFTKIPPVGVMFLAFSLVIMGPIVGMLVVFRRRRYRYVYKEVSSLDHIQLSVICC